MKLPVSKRQELTPQQAVELMQLTIVVGAAMEKVMTAHGVPIGRINYHDDGNWSVFKPGGPQLHYHLYGRARNAVRQPFGQSLYFPHRDKDPEFYAMNKPLTAEDIAAIRQEIVTALSDFAKSANT
jgi:diadenosine tetraphosphate (Ap4A) HIT family hydrolase